MNPAHRIHKSAFRRIAFAMMTATTVLLSASGVQARESKYASIVVDAASGRVLQATSPDRRSYPASLTKVMTLYLLFDALDQGKVRLDTEFAVSAHAAAQAPSKLGLNPGEHITVQDIILALVTKSANDAAVVAAEGLGGSEPAFATRMTQKAHDLGMVSTTYRNASGLPNPGQVTTPRDQALLARAIIRDHQHDYHYFATREFEFRGQTITSHNRVMLRYPGADGLKTGYINASGFNLITSAVHNGRRLVGVVFGGPTAAWRDDRMINLLDKSFARAEGGTEMADAADDEEPAAAAAPAHPAKAAAVQKAPSKKVQMAVAKLAKAAAEDDSSAESEGDDDPAAWTIQVGAFSGVKPARHAATEAARKLGGLVAEATVAVGKERSHHHVVYRATLTGFTEDQAHAACRKLTRVHKECRVLAPNA